MKSYTVTAKYCNGSFWREGKSVRVAGSNVGVAMRRAFGPLPHQLSGPKKGEFMRLDVQEISR